MSKNLNKKALVNYYTMDVNAVNLLDEETDMGAGVVEVVVVEELMFLTLLNFLGEEKRVKNFKLYVLKIFLDFI